MTLTVRLDPELENRFNQLVGEQRRTKSEVVIELLTRYVEACGPKSAYKAALKVGVFDLPETDAPHDLARNHKKPLVAALAAKHRRCYRCRRAHHR